MIMRKIFLFAIFVGLIVAETSAQQTNQYKYHIFDDYLLNPAYVGSQDYYPVVIGRDQRFYGISGSSPETYYMTLHSRVGEGYLFEKDGKINKFFDNFGNIALGFQLFQNQFGPSSETNVAMTYGYYLDLNQNYKRKNKRQLVLALSPRFKRLGVDLVGATIQNGDLVTGSGDFNDPAIGEIEKLSEWIFSTDVGGLFKTVHGEFGLTALDIVQTKNKIESDQLFINDTLGYTTYDSLYPSKIVANAKLTFIEMYNSPKFDVRFVPSVAAIYAPKTKGSEFYIDLMLEGILKEHVAGVRSEVVVKTEVGLNINYSRIYSPSIFFQPYVTFDFKNVAIQFAQTFGDSELVATQGINSGSQISVLFKLSNDRTIRSKRKAVNWNN